VGELAHVGVDVGPTSGISFSQAGGRPSDCSMGADVVDEVHHRVGQRGRQPDHRHQQHRGEQQGHGDRRQPSRPRRRSSRDWYRGQVVMHTVPANRMAAKKG
jgi:hypothetical protein